VADGICDVPRLTEPKKQYAVHVYSDEDGTPFVHLTLTPGVFITVEIDATDLARLRDEVANELDALKD